jgi:hypothetical protein
MMTDVVCAQVSSFIILFQSTAFDLSSIEATSQAPTSSIAKWTDWSFTQPYSSEPFQSLPYDHR